MLWQYFHQEEVFIDYHLEVNMILDDKVFIDPSDIQDFNDDEPDEVSQRAIESGNTRTTSTTFKGAGNDQGPTVVTTTSNKNADLILVQGNFYRTALNTQKLRA